MGSGLIEAESHATRQGFGERDRSGSPKIAAEQIGLPSSRERLLRGGEGVRLTRIEVKPSGFDDVIEARPRGAPLGRGRQARASLL